MRWNVTNLFEKLLISEIEKGLKVGIVGGSENDPEVKIIQNHPHDITFLGVEKVESFKFVYFDLNHFNKSKEKYDLVVCSQVLEHIFDVKQGIKNLVDITKVGGYIWINCPFSNHAHGSPEFYSAGYTPGLIVNLAKMYGAEAVYSSQLGSRRQHFFTHTLRFWPNKNQYNRPLWPTYSRFYLKNFSWFIIAALLKSKVSDAEETATETMVLLKRL